MSAIHRFISGLISVAEFSLYYFLSVFLSALLSFLFKEKGCSKQLCLYVWSGAEYTSNQDIYGYASTVALAFAHRLPSVYTTEAELKYFSS